MGKDLSAQLMCLTKAAWADRLIKVGSGSGGGRADTALRIGRLISSALVFKQYKVFLDAFDAYAGSKMSANMVKVGVMRCDAAYLSSGGRKR